MIDLDVVIVNWNAGEQLLDCLQSLQTACNDSFFELSNCIIVDNASTDNSLEKLERLSLPLIFIRNSENRGFASASNQGAQRADSKYILFLNPDIRLSPDGLSKSLYFMEDPKNELTGIVGIKLLDNCNVQRNTARFPSPKSLFYQMLGLDRLWPSRFPAHFMTNWDHKETREVDQVSGAFFLVRHQVFEELRGFDERFFMYYEDLDFAYRAKQAGWKSYYFAEAQAYHKGGGTSNQVKAKRLFYILRSRAYYIAKHFGYMEAVKIIIFSFIIELWVRIIWSLVNLSGTAILETLQAYLMFVREIPKLSRRIKNNSE